MGARLRGKRILVAVALVAAAVVSVLLLRGENGGEDPDGAAPTPAATPGTAVAVLEPDVTPGPVPDPGPEATPIPTFTPSPAPEPEEEVWVEIASLSGASSGRGPAFQLSGAPARLRFVMAGATDPALDVFVTREGRTSLDEGGVPEIRATGAGSGLTLLAKAAGTYYLDVYSRNASWQVVVEERVG